MKGKILSLRLYGAFDARLSDGQTIQIANKKVRAMLALLICAPNGRRSRAFLRSMLWPQAYDEHHASNSLRQCLSSLRKSLGDDSEVFLDGSDRSSVKLNLENSEILGTPADGQFLEGMDLPQLEEFEDWLREHRETYRRPQAAVLEPRPEPARATERLFPAIAVLPFYSLRGDPSEGPIGDMLAEEVSREISKSHFAKVKSHFSCRNFDTQKVVLDDLRNVLDIDYLVSGVLHCRDTSFCLKIDLIEASSGEFMWSTEFNGDVNDFFGGQSTLATEVAAKVSGSIMRKSVELARSKPLPDTKSHRLFTSAVTLLHKQDIASSARSRIYLEELARRAPSNSLVQSWLGLWYVLCMSQGWHENPEFDAARAKDCTSRALDLNPICSFSLAVDAVIENNVLKNPDEALKRFDHALDLDPNNAYGLLFSGVARAFKGEDQVAVEHTRQSRSLSPLDPGSYLFDTLSATAELSAKNYAAALRLAERSYRKNPLHNSTLRVRTIALHGLGRMEDARRSAIELSTREPNLTVEGYKRSHPAAEFETGQRWATALEESGVRKT